MLKHHYVGHLALQAQWLHCRAGATYLDEDFMGRIKHVAQKASGGGLVHTTSIVLQKWRKGTWLRWEALRPMTYAQVHWKTKQTHECMLQCHSLLVALINFD